MGAPPRGRVRGRAGRCRLVGHGATRLRPDQRYGVTNSPSRLLASGALVWLGNNIAFALLYWLVDGGGPVARTRVVPVDFAFTQQLSPEVAPAGWRPVFLDYLHLGFTNATAFSPTDVMPLTLGPST